MAGARERTGSTLTRPLTTGLLGGSFNPAHGGHRAISLNAIDALGLDELWWLVSPGNPLKAQAGMAPLAARLASAQRMARRAPIRATAIEAELGTRYTVDTLRAIERRFPKHRFVWLMGADNLAQLHQWQDWRYIMDNVPVGVLARPGDRISARMSPAARIYAPYRISGTASHLLAQAEPPAWCFVNVPMVDWSSTEIRARGDWSAS